MKELLNYLRVVILRIKKKNNQDFQFNFSCLFHLKIPFSICSMVQLLSFWYCSLCRTFAPSREHYRLSPGMNQECICEEGCCLSDAHFTHCRNLKLCSECGRGLQRRQGEAKALLFSELNTSLAISSQTCLFHRMPMKHKAFYLNLTFHPFPLTVSFCVPVLFPRSCSEESFAPSSFEVLDLSFSPLKRDVPRERPLG